MAIKTADELVEIFNTAAEGDNEKVVRMVQEVAALDTAFGGDAVAVMGVLKLLAAYSAVLKLQVQQGALQREIQAEQAALLARQQSRDAEKTADQAQTSAEIQALQAQANSITAQINALNAQLPAVLQN